MDNMRVKTKDIKEILVDYECINANNYDSRVLWCEKSFGKGQDDLKNCTDKFCEICCNGLHHDCKSRCEAQIVKIDVLDD